MEITLKIEAKELAEAIAKLAAAVSGAGAQAAATVEPKAVQAKAAKPAKPAKTSKEKPAPEPDAEEEEEKEETEEPETERDNGVDEEEARKKAAEELREIARSGKSKELKALLTEYNVPKLGGLPFEKLDEFVRKAKAL